LIWSRLTEALSETLEGLGWHTPERAAAIELQIPRDPAHGDWTTNLALALARDLKRPPRAIAEALVAAFPRDPDLIDRLEVAGPGFVNFHYARPFLDRLAPRILEEGDAFGTSASEHPLAYQVEYVSANPTGPLNIVSARAAAVGSALVRLLRASGHRVEGEFYVNDAGRQIELLGESLRARFAQSRGRDVPMPEDGYLGAYLETIARALPVEEATRRDAASDRAWFSEQAIQQSIEWQRRDLAAYGVTFDHWVRESSLHQSGEVDATLAALEARGVVYEAEGARWLRTTGFGDEKDRVIVRSNGVPTYLLPDIAYHRNKAARGFERVIDLWGPDHHGHILPMQASLEALGLPKGYLDVLIVQQVNLLSGSEVVKMSKRAGEFTTLEDLVQEVGADSAKFFFLMRSTNAHLDFDLDLAKRQNDENPAYYVQYAHARIAGLLRHAQERRLAAERSPGAGARLVAPEETVLLRLLATWPAVVRGAAQAREPHRVPTFLMEIAATFHRFYHAHRVVTDDLPLSRARLLLAEATRTVLRNGLGVMGVSAPERMERAAEATA